MDIMNDIKRTQTRLSLDKLFKKIGNSSKKGLLMPILTLFVPNYLLWSIVDFSRYSAITVLWLFYVCSFFSIFDITNFYLVRDSIDLTEGIYYYRSTFVYIIFSQSVVIILSKYTKFLAFFREYFTFDITFVTGNPNSYFNYLKNISPEALKVFMGSGLFLTSVHEYQIYHDVHHLQDTLNHLHEKKIIDNKAYETLLMHTDSLVRTHVRVNFCPTITNNHFSLHDFESRLAIIFNSGHNLEYLEIYDKLTNLQKFLDHADIHDVPKNLESENGVFVLTEEQGKLLLGDK